jgi:GAF domain
MNDHSSVDRETFQQLLASAYAVQESQISRQSLSAILDIQRSIATGRLDLDGAMHFIVESARDVADASGVAIGLLKGDRLTYRAGSAGSSAFVGQQVTASLTGSALSKTRREILRVENAQNDTRIEADICRQFGANSLLLLPIYFEGAVAGILDIRFREAHAFEDREVRTYRLLAEQVEVALSHAFQHKQHELAMEVPSIAGAALSQSALPEEVLLADDLEDAPRFWMGESSVPSFFERCQSRLAAAKQSSAFQRSISLATTLSQRAKDFPVNQREKYFRGKQQTKRFLNSSRARHYINHQRVKYLTRLQRVQYLAGHLNLRTLALVSATVLVVFTGLLAYKYHSPVSSSQSATLPKSTALDQPEIIAKPLPGKTVSEAELSPAKAPTGRTTRKRVRLAESEVQYFGDDVTVRTFLPKPAAQRSAVPKSRVKHFGDDVTVRYFNSPQPTVRPVSR